MDTVNTRNLEFWKPLQVGEGRTLFWRIGYLEFWVYRNDGEWLVAYRELSTEDLPGDAVLAEEQEKPEELGWNHFFAEEGSTFLVRPMLPDRPVVVKTEYPVHIAPGASVLFYVDIPVWLSLGISNPAGEIRSAHEFLELRTQVLSNTWFGGPMTGRLCYSLPSTLSRDMQSRSVMPHHASCPLRIRNTTKKSFSVGKISVFTEFLKIYRSAHHLWTSEAQAVFMGADELHVSVSDKKPEGVGKLTLLSHPRMSQGEHLLRKSIILLKNFTNL